MLPKGTTEPRVVLGNVWSFGLNATRPLAELLVDDERVLLRLRWSWLRGLALVFSAFGFATTWEAPRDRASAEVFGRGAMTQGVLLSAPGQASAIFWCGEQIQHAVLAALQ